jgi:hypothetical protein
MAPFYRRVVAKNSPNRGEFVISANTVNDFNELRHRSD